MANEVRKTFMLAFLLFNLAIVVVAQGTGKQFITGPCTSDADCASGCCGFKTGKCAGAIVAQERDGGCGFGNAQPNDNAARILRGQAPAASATAAAPATQTTLATVAVAAAAAQASPGVTIDPNAPGAQNVGNKAAKQFITGQCTSDADCASGCCGFNTGKCAGAIIALTRDGGCGFGNAQPNDNAARILRGQAPAASAAAAPVSQTTLATVAVAAAAQATPTINTSAPGAANVGNKAGKQFITGQCTSDADCASGCCGFNTGKCAGAIIAQTRDGGCGFGDAQPNDTAAKKLRGQA